MYRIILASESPRRKEIMKQMGIPYEVIAANVKEEVKETEPAKMVQALAGLKAGNVAGRLPDQEEEVIIIGADTMVIHRGKALGKPKNEEEAVQMIGRLSDDTHEVYTGVCMIIRKKDHEEDIISFAVSTKVVVLPLSEEEIRNYVSTGEPMDKAGAYAIQGGFGIYIKEIEGDYYNVVGFPISKIYEKLLAYGINIKKIK